jgi:hypothetical protein
MSPNKMSLHVSSIKTVDIMVHIILLTLLKRTLSSDVLPDFYIHLSFYMDPRSWSSRNGHDRK